MADHHKPTKEELEASIQEAQKDIEAMDTPPAPTPSIEIPSPSVEIIIPSASPEIPETPEAPEPPIETPPVVKPDDETPVEDKTDWKKRYSDSSREAYVQSLRNQKIQEAIQTAEELTEPTDEEMRVEFPDWEDLDSTTQRLAKDNVWNKRRFEAINKASQEAKSINAWTNKVDEFIDDPKTLIDNPELEGKKEEFKLFASKPQRRGWEFADVVLAFNGEQEKNRPAPKKGSLFPSGSAGPNDKGKQKDGRLSVEEGAILRDKDYKKYIQYLKAGKIANE